ncbi:MAG: hypothetical protein AAF387_14125 [Pseudomonadota bacterium]
MSNNKIFGWCAWAWAVTCFIVLLIIAILNLSNHALMLRGYELNGVHWLILISNSLLMAYYEGYKGFQCAYSPRFAARARSLPQGYTRKRALLAPFFCMGFFDAPRRRIIAAYLLTAMIVFFVLLFRVLPQPWRGALDVGVVIGLSWGCIATMVSIIQSLRFERPIVDPEIV